MSTERKTNRLKNVILNYLEKLILTWSVTYNFVLKLFNEMSFYINCHFVFYFKFHTHFIGLSTDSSDSSFI